jgi:shikimate kinase
MKGCRKIYLLGFMGSGKTTAGKKLAALMGWSFIDIDNSIEESTGKKIADIFSENGEEYFRKLESEAIRKFSEKDKVVISTGGGAPCYHNNLDYMLQSGCTIYLKLTPAQLKSRLIGGTRERPLIKNLKEKDLLNFIEEKLQLRESYYNRADIITDGFDLEINDLFSLIRHQISICHPGGGI